MSTPLDTVASVLGPAASVLDAVGVGVPGVGGTVLRVLAAAARFASDLATRGIDPLEHIERLHAAEPELKTVQSAWRARLDALYPTP